MNEVPGSIVECSPDQTRATITTWVEMATPPNGHRLRIQVDLTWDSVVTSTVDVTAVGAYDENGFVKRESIPVAQMLENARVLSAEIIGVEVNRG